MRALRLPSISSPASPEKNVSTSARNELRALGEHGGRTTDRSDGHASERRPVRVPLTESCAMGGSLRHEAVYTELKPLVIGIFARAVAINAPISFGCAELPRS